MTRYLAVLIWPAGLAVIFGGAWLLARRAPDEPDRRARNAVRRGMHRASGGDSAEEAVMGSIKLAFIAGVGTIAAVGVMCLLGLLVVYHGLAIDRPIFHWVTGHQVHAMAQLMGRLTKIGDTWTAWGAAAAAAVCLAVTWRTKRWVPPVALGMTIFLDHYATQALRHVFHRLGPPTSPLGTYPSGGVDRCIVFYGLIAYLLWREFSGRQRTAIWAGAVVAALGFNEAYSRVYLSLHWFTDALSGLVYGCLLLAAFVVAVRAVAGRNAAVGVVPVTGGSPA
jgi:membrane-associated phospholipid phosphatase